MSNIEAVTITVSVIAIAVAVVAAIMFWWYGNMQRWYQHLSRTSRKNPAQAAEAGGVMKLFTASLKEELSPEKREVLETVVRMNSARHLTSLFDDPTEKFYLFEALTDPSRYPWEEREEPPPGARTQRKAARQAR
jgi:hypothetical protein